MEMNDKNPINAKDNIPRDLGFEATTASDFCFISYNSEDAGRASPYVRQLYDEGIPLWYDKGLEYGKRWEEEIGIRIANSKAVILFFTLGILGKEDSYVQREFRMAKNHAKKIYIVMVDKLEPKHWQMYPRKSSFLDDLQQTHSCSCQAVEHIIGLIKDAVATIPTKPAAASDAKRLPFTEPTIVDSETLLSNGYFTARELSERHVELDRMTVDEKLFPDALEIEGDADTWESMVVDTADCTGNLVVNNKIVGYMDFIPVEPESYDLLRTEPFSDEYVAFYSFGGSFDIYVSMFSIDINHATPKSYTLFFQWMINRILDLRDNNGVYINRICFSIYSRSQAAILQSLNCKKVLESKLKGFLYETRAKDLLNNERLLSNVIKKRISTYDIYTTRDEAIIGECNKIAEPLLARNGGILQYENAAADADVIITAKVSDKTVGYVGLKKYDILDDGIYIEQIAVSERYQGFGIGEQLMRQAIRYASLHGCARIYANCQKINEISQSLFRKLGFRQFDMSEEQYLGIGVAKEAIDRNYAFVYIIK